MNRAYTAYKNGLNGSNSRGRISKTRSSRSGISSTSHRKGTARPSRKPYTPVEYSREECLRINKVYPWDPARLVKGVKKIHFDDDFDVRE
jgi:hypothetical protein